MAYDLEEGDVVLCTVDRIVGTIVFVNIEGDGEGSIILSEIAPGRIRNLRDYVVPKKKIVCKVLRIQNGKINLSLRRVTQKEKAEVLERHKQEKSYVSILKTILKDKSEEIIKKITEKERLFDFFEEIRDNPKKLESLVGKKDAQKILDIILSQKPKKATTKKEISLNTTDSEGINKIKKIFADIKDAEVRYISAGRYSIKTEAENIKQADNKLKEILLKIENQAKKENMNFSFK